MQIAVTSKISGANEARKQSQKGLENYKEFIVWDRGKNKQTTINEIKLGDNSLTSPKDIAGGFIDYSSNIGPNLAGQTDNTNFNFET